MGLVFGSELGLDSRLCTYISLCHLLMCDLERVTSQFPHLTGVDTIIISLQIAEKLNVTIRQHHLQCLVLQVQNGPIPAISCGSAHAWRVLSTVLARGPHAFVSERLYHGQVVRVGTGGEGGLQEGTQARQGGREERVKMSQNYGNEGFGDTALPKTAPGLPLVILKPPVNPTHTCPGPS